MSIDHTRGYVRWVPTLDQVGTQDLTVEVQDIFGARATQSFTVTVQGSDPPPLITTTPVVEAASSSLYTYAVGATQPENETLTFSLLPTNNVQPPSGMTINSSTGVLTWVAGAVGEYPITIQVEDTQHSIATQSYTLSVVASNLLPPVITSGLPPALAGIGIPYTFQFTATDPQGLLLYPWSGVFSDPAMGIDATTGLFTWTPTSPGSFGATVYVTDSAGLIAQETFSIAAQYDSPPTVPSIPDASITAGLPFRYDVQAFDQDYDTNLTYSLQNAPAGMTIDGLGQISWNVPVLPNTASAETYSNITVVVTDSVGLQTPQSFTLTVNPDTQAPAVSLTLNATPTGPERIHGARRHAGDGVALGVG